MARAFFLGDGQRLVLQVRLAEVEQRLPRHGRIGDALLVRDQVHHRVHQGALSGGAGGLDQHRQRPVLLAAKPGKIDGQGVVRLADHAAGLNVSGDPIQQPRCLQPGQSLGLLGHSHRRAGLGLSRLRRRQPLLMHRLQLQQHQAQVALDRLGRKTRRGLQGVARSGRHTGGRVYGYRIRRELDSSGEPIRGLRDIDPAEAEVVREIFRRYAAGVSPRAIVSDLNARGVPSPHGKKWNASTINGDAANGNGVIHNALYRGELVFGRQTWIKDRHTGKRKARTAEVADLVRTQVPALRIVSDDLWQSVRERYAQNQLGPHKTSPLNCVRPRHLLSGKLTCGVCGGPMIRSGDDLRFVCSWRRERGTAICTNGRSMKGGEIETRVLAAVKDRLLTPERVALAVEEARAAAEHATRTRTLGRAKAESELAEVKRRAERLVDQVADGVLSGLAVKDRWAALETRRAELETELAATPPTPIVALHPRLADQYRAMVASLEQALVRSDSEAAAEARDLVRRLIKTVVVTPLPERGKFALTVKGKIAALVSQDGYDAIVVGAGVGFEPTTFRL
ncbi:recombinase family protein [Brevundimonas nasdae]|uniref:recombinase family protein n=1 Tax=Brevundimonas nasdae TaxID=172043 RepID=UPI003F6931B0